MTLLDRDGIAIARIQKLRFSPLAVTCGEGVYLVGEGGRRLLDFSASWGAASLGHSHPAIRGAVMAALDSQAGASILSSINQPAVELAEQLLDLTPGSGERRVWLGHSGSDANETAARAVTAATGRSRIISFIGAYHGGTTGSMAISAHSSQEGVDKAPGLVSLPYPDPYHPHDGDPSGRSVIALLERRFAEDVSPQDVAALFFEPIQSDGGLIVPPPGFLRELDDLCCSHGILMVCDEVKVGLGRSGMLHCFQHEGIVPDLVVFGKGLGGGLPISALVGPAEILDHQSAFSMQTLHGNPVTASAASAVLNTIAAEDLTENAERVGARLQEQLRDLQEKHELIGDVRGRGLAVGVELVLNRDSREHAPVETAKVVIRAHELGLVLFYVGMNSNVLEMTPPLVVTTEQVDEAIAVLDQALIDVAEGRVPDEKLEGYAGW